MMERLNNEINIFADTITSTQRAGHIIQINRKPFCDLRHVQIEKTIVQSLSLKETFSLSFFMKANHCEDNEACIFANIETKRRIQKADIVTKS